MVLTVSRPYNGFNGFQGHITVKNVKKPLNNVKHLYITVLTVFKVYNGFNGF